MLLTKDYVLGKFAKEVKEGKYNRISYDEWRILKKETPDYWDVYIDGKWGVIEWDGCSFPFEYPIDDGSLGSFIWNLLLPVCQVTFDTANFSNALEKCSMTAHQATENMKNLTNALDIRKENDNMNLFKGFDFGSCENDNVKMSIYGVAVKNANGTWVSYDPKSGNVIDVDILNFNAKYLYKMPVALKDVAIGDTIIHNRKPMFVSKVESGKVLAIDPAAGEEKVILMTKNLFNFDFITKVVNLFGNFADGASADAPFGNMLPLMLLNDSNKSDDMLPLMFMMNGGKFDMSNPMMLYFLMKDNKSGNDMLPLFLMSNFNGNKCICNCECNCDCEG